MMPNTDIKTIIKEQENNTMIAHYTTMEGLHGLIQNSEGVGTQLQLNFWASSIFAMNDPKELMHGYDVIWKWLPEIEQETKTPPRFRLSRIWELYSSNKESNYNEILKESFYKHKEVPYLLSFSHSIDSLPMYRWYSNDGQGISMIFSLGELKNDGMHLKDVMYHTGEKTNAYTTDDIVRPIYEMYIEAINTNNDSGKTFSIMLEHLTMLSLLVAPYIKTIDYEHEKEIRFAKLNKLNQDIRFRLSKNGNIIPYIIQSISINALKKIIIGPCADYLTAKRMIELELYSKGIDWIPVEKSETNYRRY